MQLLSLTALSGCFLFLIALLVWGFRDARKSTSVDEIFRKWEERFWREGHEREILLTSLLCRVQSGEIKRDTPIYGRVLSHLVQAMAKGWCPSDDLIAEMTKEMKTGIVSARNDPRSLTHDSLPTSSVPELPDGEPSHGKKHG